MGFKRGYQDHIDDVLFPAVAPVLAGVGTIAALLTTAGGSKVDAPAWGTGGAADETAKVPSHCKSILVSTAGTITLKTTHNSNAVAVPFPVGEFKIAITEITNMGAAVATLLF